MVMALVVVVVVVVVVGVVVVVVVGAGLAPALTWIGQPYFVGQRIGGLWWVMVGYRATARVAPTMSYHSMTHSCRSLTHLLMIPYQHHLQTFPCKTIVSGALSG
jgi:hypothetical protein